MNDRRQLALDHRHHCFKNGIVFRTRNAAGIRVESLPDLPVPVGIDESLTQDGRDRSLDYKITGFHVPPGSRDGQVLSELEPAADPPALVVQVGRTEVRYQLRGLDDLHTMLKRHGDWMALGSADEQKPAAEGTVEAWARSPKNPVGGFYGLKKGLRGRFGMYVPPVMEGLGLAEVEHQPRNNRMRAR